MAAAENVVSPVELLEVVDEATGCGTGDVLPRSVVHDRRLWHRVVHVLLVDAGSTSRLPSNHASIAVRRQTAAPASMLVQQRSAEKKTHPLQWDVAAAGHIAHPETPLETAVREVSEELGISLSPDRLVFHCVVRLPDEFEFSHVFVCHLPMHDHPVSSLTLQTEEVSAATWVPLHQALSYPLVYRFARVVLLESLVAAAAKTNVQSFADLEPLVEFARSAAGDSALAAGWHTAPYVVTDRTSPLMLPCSLMLLSPDEFSRLPDAQVASYMQCADPLVRSVAKRQLPPEVALRIIRLADHSQICPDTELMAHHADGLSISFLEDLFQFRTVRENLQAAGSLASQLLIPKLIAAAQDTSEGKAAGFVPAGVWAWDESLLLAYLLIDHIDWDRDATILEQLVLKRLPILTENRALYIAKRVFLSAGGPINDAWVLIYETLQATSLHLVLPVAELFPSLFGVVAQEWIDQLLRCAAANPNFSVFRLLMTHFVRLPDACLISISPQFMLETGLELLSCEALYMAYLHEWSAEFVPETAGFMQRYLSCQAAASSAFLPDFVCRYLEFLACRPELPRLVTMIHLRVLLDFLRVEAPHAGAAQAVGRGSLVAVDDVMLRISQAHSQAQPCWFASRFAGLLVELFCTVGDSLSAGAVEKAHLSGRFLLSLPDCFWTHGDEPQVLRCLQAMSEWMTTSVSDETFQSSFLDLWKTDQEKFAKVAFLLSLRNSLRPGSCELAMQRRDAMLDAVLRQLQEAEDLHLRVYCNFTRVQAALDTYDLLFDYAAGTCPRRDLFDLEEAIGSWTRLHGLPQVAGVRQFLSAQLEVRAARLELQWRLADVHSWTVDDVLHRLDVANQFAVPVILDQARRWLDACASVPFEDQDAYEHFVRCVLTCANSVVDNHRFNALFLAAGSLLHAKVVTSPWWMLSQQLRDLLRANTRLAAFFAVQLLAVWSRDPSHIRVDVFLYFALEFTSIDVAPGSIGFSRTLEMARIILGESADRYCSPREMPSLKAAVMCFLELVKDDSAAAPRILTALCDFCMNHPMMTSTKNYHSRGREHLVRTIALQYLGFITLRWLPEASFDRWSSMSSQIEAVLWKMLEALQATDVRQMAEGILSEMLRMDMARARHPAANSHAFPSHGRLLRLLTNTSVDPPINLLTACICIACNVVVAQEDVPWDDTNCPSQTPLVSCDPRGLTFHLALLRGVLMWRGAGGTVLRFTVHASLSHLLDHVRTRWLPTCQAPTLAAVARLLEDACLTLSHNKEWQRLYKRYRENYNSHLTNMRRLTLASLFRLKYVDSQSPVEESLLLSDFRLAVHPREFLEWFFGATLVRPPGVHYRQEALQQLASTWFSSPDRLLLLELQLAKDLQALDPWFPSYEEAYVPGASPEMGLRRLVIDANTRRLDREKEDLTAAAAAAAAGNSDVRLGGELGNGSGWDGARPTLQLLQQRKITPWNDMEMDNVLSSLSVTGKRQSSGMGRQDLLVCASFVDKAPNLAGLTRTCEVFRVKLLTFSNLKVLDDFDYKAISVTADRWQPLAEVPVGADLLGWLRHMKYNEQYTLVAAEQTSQSIPLQEFVFPARTLLLLGKEKEGVPADFLAEMDFCVEVPQLGVIRSLNVHVTASLFVWEYTRQMMRPSAVATVGSLP